jgi:hypothetical protein
MSFAVFCYTEIDKRKGATMPTRRWIRVLIGLLLVVIISGGIAGAQDGDGENPALLLISVDAERPVLFQVVEPGADPVTADFTPRLEIPLDEEHEQALIFTALENTGWSTGAIGLVAEVFDPEADYVVLELWERIGKLTVRDDGHGLVFPLIYSDDLDGDDTPGFRLDLATDQGRIFCIYRVIDSADGGLLVRGQTAHVNGVHVETERVSLLIDPAPVLGDLLLDAHIIALPRPILTPTPTLEG